MRRGVDPWPPLTAHVEDTPLLGYERGDGLDAARRYGFTPLGPLRVWIKGALADSLRSHTRMMEWIGVVEKRRAALGW